MAVFRFLKLELQKKYMSVFLPLVRKAVDSSSVRNIAIVDFPMLGFLWSYKIWAVWPSSVVCLELSQAVSSFVPNIYLQVLLVRSPFLYFNCVLSLDRSVRKRLY